MDLYDRIKNIYGKDNEQELKKSITKIKDILSGLIEERMCKVYSRYLLKELNNRHVPARLINTLDLGLNYEHEFILVPSNTTGYFLSDLTFSQFNNKSKELSELLIKGYQYIDNKTFNRYINVISKETINNNLTPDDLFYSFYDNVSNIKK